MGRRIVTRQYHAAGAAAEVDTYFDRVVKYIPVDIVSAWVFVSSAINSASDNVPKPTIQWIAFFIGLILTALWTLKQTSAPNKPPAITQTAIATFAFAVWVFGLGGPFVTLLWYRPLYGSLLLVLYTLIVALIITKE